MNISIIIEVVSTLTLGTQLRITKVSSQCIMILMQHETINNFTFYDNYILRKGMDISFTLSTLHPHPMPPKLSSFHFKQVGMINSAYHRLIPISLL